MYIEPTYLGKVNVNLNFTWNCTQVNETLMQFKLDFENPVDISPYLPFDTIIFATSWNFTLQNVTISSNIKPQMAEKNFTKSQEKIGQVVESAMKAFGGMNIVISIWLQGVLNQILGVIQSLAIIVHFPLLAVPTPANVQMINNFLVPIVTFEVLDSALTTELVYDFDETK